MRMLKPSPGEVHDRMSILSLKMNAATKLNKPSAHFKDEYDELETYLYKNFPKKEGASVEHLVKYDSLLRDLLETNTQLWKLEDDIRALLPEMEKATIPVEAQCAERFLDIAIAIPRLNDNRASLVRDINKFWGITGAEKLHA